MFPVGQKTSLAGFLIAAAAFPLHSAAAAPLDFSGSLGEGGFARYVPAVTNPIFNETPLITTELRPIYFRQKIPSDFPSGGGDIDVVAAQLRVAITNRLGFLATTDGYAWADFDAALPDSSGFADLAVGLKYAVVYDPAAGEALTLGLRYTLPSGNLDVGNIDLTGYGAGSLHIFASGLKQSGPWQFQGNVGVQQALSGDATSFAYGSAHVSYEVLPGLYPLAELNVFLPYDGGDRLPGSQLTGVDVADFGSSDPKNSVTVAGGLRWRPAENVILGGAFEYNLSESPDHLMEWRAMFDAVIHF